MRDYHFLPFPHVTQLCIHRRERHDIPLIVQTCVDEVEKRGLTEVGVYRVAGVLRDVEELRQAFDTGGNNHSHCTVYTVKPYFYVQILFMQIMRSAVA